MQKCKKCRVNLKKNWHNTKGIQRLICPKCWKTVSLETKCPWCKVEKKTTKKPQMLVEIDVLELKRALVDATNVWIEFGKKIWATKYIKQTGKARFMLWLTWFGICAYMFFR